MKLLLRAASALMLLLSMTAVLTGAPAEAATNAATYVFGQSGNFTTANSGANAAQLNTPHASAHDFVHHRLFIADTSSNRVLIYNLNSDNSIPDSTADYVLGQTNFTNSGAALTVSGMSTPGGVAYDDTHNRLYVGDTGNKRILVFAITSITNGMNASYVLGQADFTSQAQATTQTGIWDAEGVALGQGGRYLFATDKSNRRVMVWDTTTLSNGMGATYVLGQSSFTGTTFAVSQSAILFPTGVAVDAATNKLFVAENGGNRISVFDLGSLATGMNMSYVIGQVNFTTNPTGLSQTTLNSPVGVAAGGGRVFVVDAGNQRALVFDATNTSNGQPAVAVYGQPDYTSSTVNNGGRTANSLGFPNGVSFDPGTYRFFVADSLNNRVLGYDAVVSTTTIGATVDPSMTFSVAGRASTCNGQSATNFQTGSTATAVSLGRLSGSAISGGAQDLTVGTNAANGFTVYLRTSGTTPDALSAGAGHSISDVTGTRASPGGAPTAGTPAFGYTSSDVSTAFTSNTWAKLTNTNDSVIIGPSGTTSKSACAGYEVASSTSTFAGSYAITVVYSAVPSF